MYPLYALLFSIFCQYHTTPHPPPPNQHLITEYGAVGDGLTLNTVAIQNAIDSCAAQGGGRVVVPSGRFLTGSVWMKNGVTLYLEQDAVLLGSTKRDHYQKNKWYALLLAHSAQRIGVEGSGTIDGQGAALAADVDRMYHEGKLDGGYKDNRPHEKHRPQLIDFEQCKNVHIQGITFRDAACWIQRYGGCDSLVVEDIRVISMAFWNNDGIDLVDCTNTLVQNSFFNTADDGICLKSDGRDKACNNILIRNCKVRSSASALKFGTNSYGGFKNIKVEYLEVYDTYRSAVALETVDGGVLENIDVGHIKATNTGNAIFLRLGQRHTKKAGTLRNIYIHDIEVQVPAYQPDWAYPHPGPPVKEPHNLFPSSILGIPEHPVEQVRIERVRIEFAGGGNCAVACMPKDSLHKIPERVDAYPEFSMLGELPAWGFYCRHVRGLEFTDITLVLKSPDYRPALVLDDVQGFKKKKWRVKHRFTVVPPARVPVGH